MPAMPQFFQHVGPMISSTLGPLSRFSKLSGATLQGSTRSEGSAVAESSKDQDGIVVSTHIELGEVYKAKAHGGSTWVSNV